MGWLEEAKKALQHALKIVQGMADEQNKLYDAAYSSLNKDASPRDIAPDMLGCAESVSNVIQKAFPELRFPTIVSTLELFNYLKSSPSFEPCDEDYGVILIYPTSTGNGKLSNGHVFITGKNVGPDGTRWLMSNNSFTGTWEVTGTLQAARKYYAERGGFHEFFYRKVERY